MDLALNPVKTGTGQLEWFSIDYSAATDRLSARLSASILDFLVQGQDEAMQNVWRAVLAPHYCRYPFPYPVEPVQQVNGQLMGSILSFPILCLANLGLYLETIKEDPRSLRDKLKGVLVNGDDMLYVAPTSLWNSHVSNGAKVGLSMSPGKAYHHPVYANANSACYHFDLRALKLRDVTILRGARREGGLMTPVYEKLRVFDKHSSTPYYIPFLNAGLYFGQHKVLGGDDVDGSSSFSSVINRLVQGALPGKGAEILAGYVKRHSKALDEECAGRNLFLPISLGGLGVQAPEGWKVKYTNQQLAYAQSIIDATPFGTLSQLPLNQEHVHSIPEAPQPLRAPWLAGKIHFDDEGLVVEEQKPCNLERKKLRNAYSRYFLHCSDYPRVPRVKSLLFDLRISGVKREGSTYRSRAPISNPFAKRTERDRLLQAFEDDQQSVTA